MIFYYVFWKVGERFSLINHFTDESKAKTLLKKIKSKLGEGKIVEKEVNSKLDELCIVCFSCNWIPHFKTKSYTIQQNGSRLYHYECGECHISLIYVSVKSKSINHFVGDY